MKQPLLTALLSALAFSLPAAEPAKPAAGKAAQTTATFYITEVKCSSCASSIDESLRKLPTVTKVDSLSENTGFAIVTFDPKTVSHHQVAQAVFAAAPVHGDPYIAALKFTIDGYAKGDNAAKVDAVLAKYKTEVRAELKNKGRGEFALFFEPLRVSGAKKGPQGWNLDEFLAALQEPAPKGLGLKVTFASEQ